MSLPDVAIVAPYPTAGQRHAGPSGVASYTANLAHALKDRGAVVHVVAPTEPSAPREPEITVDDGVIVRRGFDRGPTALLHATRRAVATGAPIVHLQHEMFLYGGPQSVPAVVPALALLRRRRRAVVTLHQVVDPQAVDRGYTRTHRVPAPATVAKRAVQAIQRSIAGLAHACIVHEPPFADVVQGAVVIAHGVEERETPPRAQARQRFGIDDRFVVLCFGFVSPYKGLEACLSAREFTGDDVLLVVAGGPHPRLAARGDRYADSLRQRFAGAGARFTGWVPEADVSAWHAAADVALLAYPQPFSSSGALALAISHGTGVLLSEAMGACIGADPSLVTPIEPERLAKRLRELADEPLLLDDVRRATARLGEGRRWSTVADDHLRLYESVLS